MPSEPLPNKRDVMLALLAEASVFIHLDPRGPAVRIPPWFKNQPQLVLQVGLNMAVPIPDLDVGEEGISCTLSFSRRPYYCSIPWKAVFGLVREGGPGLVWPDDVPVEVAAQVQAQGQKSPGQKPKADPGRGRLRAVGSERPEPEGLPSEQAAASVSSESTATPSVQAAPSIKAAPAPALAQAEADLPTDGDGSDPVKPLRPLPGGKSGAKREIPSYLRVVK